ncbi:MAG: FxsA family protein [Rhodobacteraceae bacterium]|jgi:UPF0716 protein FxsA|nr:FxsA family protein [Paracoccaceae bacterium]
MWPIVAILALPLIEIALFIVIGGVIGLWPTLGLVVLAGIAGLAILRGRGVGMVLDVRRSLDRGQDPAAALVQGALSVLAGFLLVIPGFLTDAVALALLLPPVRARITARLRAASVAAQHQTARHGSATVIDGTWHEVQDDTPPQTPPGASGWTRH